MTDAAQTEQANQEDESMKGIGGVPSISIQRSSITVDMATVLGLAFALGLIVTAIVAGESNANFFNAPALMIVLFGTIFATSVSYTAEEISRAGHLIAKSMLKHIQSPSKLATSLIDLAVVAKKKGVLALSGYETELRKDKFLERTMQMVIDGFNADDIERISFQEIEALVERHKRSASIMRRASETAPAMGLIGTLVGLVQMLADLENPEAIGPSMAIALLTTFYGAILGTVVCSPLAAKLEKNSNDEALIKTLITTTAVSIARQENPRRLEMLLNSELPPDKRIRYFD